MEVGPGLLVLVSALTGLVLTYVLRTHWSELGPAGRLWRAVETLVGIFLVIGMLYAAGLQVVVRYGFATFVDVPWTEEFARLLLVWAAFWGAMVVQRSDDHMAVTVFVEWLPPGAQVYVRLLGDAVAVIFLGVLVWYGWWLARLQHGISMITFDFPAAILDYSVPVSGAVILLQTVRLAMLRVRGKRVSPSSPGEI